MAKATTPKKEDQSECCAPGGAFAASPSPIKVQVIGPFREPYCFLYRASAGGYYNFGFKRHAEVTQQEWRDPDITIYKMARHHHAVIRHQKLDNKKGTLEIFEGPRIDVSRDGSQQSERTTVLKLTCEGDCPPYEVEECPMNSTAFCDPQTGELTCIERIAPSNDQQPPTNNHQPPANKKRKSGKPRPTSE